MIRIKNSTRVLTATLLFLLGMALVTDAMLRDVYRKMNLDDPQKNFQTILIPPFTAIQISGGNTYRIEIVKAPRFALKILRSRKSFFNSSRAGDTLKIRWTVATRSNTSMEDAPIGLTIECPDLLYLYFSGTRNIVHAFNVDSLRIRQDGDTRTILTESNIRRLDLAGSQGSWFDLGDCRFAGSFNLDLQGESGIRLHNITWGQFHPIVGEKASILFIGPSVHFCP